MLDNVSEVSMQLSSDESAIDIIDDSNDPTRKRKLRELDPQGNNIESVNQDFDAQQFAEELETQLLQMEEISSEPLLKKSKQEKVRSAAYTHGYKTGLSRMERTNADLKKINVPKKYIKEEDREEFRLGYKEGHEFMTKTFAGDKYIFYSRGIENGEKEALKSYSLNRAPFVNSPSLSAGLFYKEIYGYTTQTKLRELYCKGFSLGYHYYCGLLDNYYQNYLKAYGAVIASQLPEVVINKPFQENELSPDQLENMKLQAVAGHKEGTELGNLVIANNCQKNHLAIFKLQIQRLAKLYEAGDVNWTRQQSFIAKLHPKAWKNRGYILRNFFYPKQIEYFNGLIAKYCYADKEEAISHFILFQLLLPNKFTLEVTNESVKISLHIDTHKILASFRCVDSLAKSVRWDDNIFFDKFLRSITKSPINQTEEKLRKGRHKKYTVFGHGVFERRQKASPYNLPLAALILKKKKTSLPQSASLVFTDQPIFGHNANRNNKLAGCIFKPSKLISRLFFRDMGTVSRPYEFDDRLEALAYFNQRVKSQTPTMFKTLAELKLHIVKQRAVNGIKNHNEVLARLKWDINTSSIGIFSDTFEARCIAQFYAKLTYRRLLCQYRELDKTLPQDYEVPIVFYLPGSDLNWQIYSTEQQANDKIKAEAIFSDEAKIKEAFDQDNFEFLLLLDDFEQLIYQNLPVIFWIAYACSMNIAKMIYEQTSESFLLSFEDYLNDTLLKTWRLEKNCLYAERRNIYLSMALKLDLNDLVKEILKTNLVDEKDSDKYGNFLFQLIEAGQFKLLIELLTNQKIDLNHLNQINEIGDTLLHIAAKVSHLELTKLLVEKGANTNIRNKNDDTPLVRCIQKHRINPIENTRVIRLLLQHSSKDIKGLGSVARAMERACSLLNLQVVREFLPLNERFKEVHCTIIYARFLHTAILAYVENYYDHDAQIQIVRILLKAGADPNYLYQGRSALQVAYEKNLVGIIKELEVSINKPSASSFLSK